MNFLRTSALGALFVTAGFAAAPAGAPAYTGGWDVTEPVADRTAAAAAKKGSATFTDVPQAIWRDRPTAAANVPRDFSLRMTVEAREPLAAGTVVFAELDARQLPVAAGSAGLSGLRIRALDAPGLVALPLQVIPLADQPGQPGPALVLWSLDAALAAGHRREFMLAAGKGAGADVTLSGPLSLEVSATVIAIGNGSYRFEFDPQKNAAPRQLTFLPAGRRVEVASADGLNGKSARLGVPGEPIRVRLGSAANPAAALGCVLDVPGSLPLSSAFGVRFHLRQLFLAGSPFIESWMRIPAQTVPERIVSLQLQSHRFRRGDFSVAREEEGEEGDERLRGPTPGRVLLRQGGDAFGMVGHRLSLPEVTENAVTVAGGWQRGRLDGRTHPWTGEAQFWHARVYAGPAGGAEASLRSLVPWRVSVQATEATIASAPRSVHPAAQAAIEVLWAAAAAAERTGRDVETVRLYRNTARQIAQESEASERVVAVQKEGVAVLANAQAAFLFHLGAPTASLRAVWSSPLVTRRPHPITLAEDPVPLWNLRVIESGKWSEWSAAEARLTGAHFERPAAGAATLRLEWERRHGGTAVTARAAFTLSADSSLMQSQFETGALPAGVALWEVDFPIIAGVGAGRADRAGAFLAIPHWTGIRLDEPALRTFVWDGMLYPGAAGWQFVDYYADGDGFYLGAHDDRGHQKRYRHDPEGDRLTLRYTHLAPDMGRSGQAYTMPYPCVFGPHPGDWYDAVQIYREFLLPTPWFPKKTLAEDERLPKWFKESPLCVRIFSGDKQQEISSFVRPNLELVRALGSPPTIVQWYGWNDTKPHMVARPEQRPDPKFPAIARQFADAGLHVFPYTCALLWDVRNPSYKNAGGEATAMRDLEGNIVMARYGGQPLAMVSPVHPAYQRLMESVMTNNLNSVDVPGVYFDMFGTASGGHYLAQGESKGGNTRTLGMRELVRRYKGVALARNPNFVMWMEGNADCYLDHIDGFISFMGNLPMRHAIYGEFRRPFGDKTCAWGGPPLELRDPASQFAWGAPVGRVFDRELYTDTDKTVLDAAKVAYYRNLVAHRIVATPWLAYGRMLRPLVRRDIAPAEPAGILEGDSVPHAVWRAPDGTVAFVFSNARKSTAVDFNSTIDPAEYGIPTDGSWALHRLTPEGEAPAYRPAFAHVQRIGGTNARRLERKETIAAAGVLILVARPLLP